MNRKHLIIVPFITVIITGCSIPEQTVMTEKPVQVPVLQKYEEFQKDTVSGDTVSLQPDTITLPQAIKLALLHSPELKVYSYNLRAWDAEILQQSLLPNPEAGLELENIAGGKDYRGAGASEITLSVGQLIELGKKREKRTRVAALSGNLAAWDYESKKLDVYTRVLKTFYNILALQEQLAQSRRLLQLAEELSLSIEKRVLAGASSPAEQARAKIEVERAAMTVESIRYQLKAAHAALAATWGDDIATFRAAKGSISIPDQLPDLGSLKLLLVQNPDLKRMEAVRKKREADIALQKALGVPDPVISFGYRRLNEISTNAFVAGVSIPIPYFDRNQGNIKKAQIFYQQTEAEKQALQITLSNRLTLLYQRLKDLQSQAHNLHDKIIPQAEGSLDILRQGYREGKYSFLEVLDAQRSLFAAYTRYLQIQSEYRDTVSSIERLTGQSLTTVAGNNQ
ncbi:MAG: TolC family protein [Chlorobi bacterium]|nr:TolC family protein [Chlorobiota bacterium]